MTENADKRRWRPWRVTAWSTLAALISLPAIAMQYTSEVNWGVFDFIVFGIMLLGVGIALELSARGDIAYRFACGVAVATAFLLVWINLAVGIIGSENDLSNLLFAGVLLIAVIGALLARFRPAGMAQALFATALAQVVVGVTALTIDLGSEAPSFPGAILVFTAVFAGLWLGSAHLFSKAST